MQYVTHSCFTLTAGLKKRLAAAEEKTKAVQYELSEYKKKLKDMEALCDEKDTTMRHLEVWELFLDDSILYYFSTRSMTKFKKQLLYS